MSIPNKSIKVSCCLLITSIVLTFLSCVSTQYDSEWAQILRRRLQLAGWDSDTYFIDSDKDGYLRLDVEEESKIHSIKPLEGVPLTFLCLAKTGVVDLSPLKDVPLVYLDISDTKVTDLSPLKGMATLTGLSCMQTEISDLSPLKGMNLSSLYISETKVQDISPLEGCNIKKLYLSDTQISDISGLNGVTRHIVPWGKCLAISCERE